MTGLGGGRTCFASCVEAPVTCAVTVWARVAAPCGPPPPQTCPQTCAPCGRAARRSPACWRARSPSAAAQCRPGRMLAAVCTAPLAPRRALALRLPVQNVLPQRPNTPRPEGSHHSAMCTVWQRTMCHTNRKTEVDDPVAQTVDSSMLPVYLTMTRHVCHCLIRAHMLYRSTATSTLHMGLVLAFYMIHAQLLFTRLDSRLRPFAGFVVQLCTTIPKNSAHGWSFRLALVQRTTHDSAVTVMHTTDRLCAVQTCTTHAGMLQGNVRGMHAIVTMCDS